MRLGLIVFAYFVMGGFGVHVVSSSSQFFYEEPTNEESTETTLSLSEEIVISSAMENPYSNSRKPTDDNSMSSRSSRSSSVSPLKRDELNGVDTMAVRPPGQPTITKNPPYVWLNDIDATLICRAPLGDEDTELKWYWKGRHQVNRTAIKPTWFTFEKENKRKGLLGKSELNIHPLDYEKYEGSTFYCVLENPAGKTQATHVVQIWTRGFLAGIVCMVIILAISPAGIVSIYRAGKMVYHMRYGSRDMGHYPLVI